MVHPVIKYIIRRLIMFIITIWLGLTIAFIVSRALPFNYVDQAISQLIAVGSFTISGAELQRMKQQLLELYGLDKPLWLQYLLFLKNYATGNMGVSFAYFPTPVSTRIAQVLPYSIALLMTTTIISWIIGNLIGLWAAVTKRKRASAIIEYLALGIQPIPFAALAIGFMVFYALVLRLPIYTYGGYTTPQMSIWEQIVMILRRAMLPAIVLLLFNWVWSALSMKSIALKMKNEDFITYMSLQGAPEKALNNAIFRNSLIPQYTGLVLGVARIFVGSALVESLFNYPGVGVLLSAAITTGDYNMMLGIVFMSIVAVGAGTVILDLTYPLIDPRIRYPGGG